MEFGKTLFPVLTHLTPVLIGKDGKDLYDILCVWRSKVEVTCRIPLFHGDAALRFGSVRSFCTGRPGRMLQRIDVLSVAPAAWTRGPWRVYPQNAPWVRR